MGLGHVDLLMLGAFPFFIKHLDTNYASRFESLADGIKLAMESCVENFDSYVDPIPQ